ncbi:lysophospholipid acyltransferase LPEAT2 [Senna tora]|uniref:Lysophospholipid acyltransferase LPEAT2 n=1 Tax=Senna tora TaxID=362788 RepID=A0A834T0V7_9FABA|nr:lysophospholipid acyltransferase LPEAT2 [Senna tora]
MADHGITAPLLSSQSSNQVVLTLSDDDSDRSSAQSFAGNNNPNFPILIDPTTAKPKSSFACRLPWSVLLYLGSLCSSDMSQRNWLFKDGRIRRTRCREDDDGGGGGGRWRR